ncbi:SDR family oxidoreductase [Hazenella sp. IB182357]|uniref:SDR family oxidoreductase n=1 Tax=Polycladospora coralii TaxID=2771432 RepID=A0A926RX99_9BACL|nr:SDR family oxidoreductase [Polycladospora coralii]MBD1372316.1 SDR family oxidoreductase [Polycladospora coralii]MBS7531494.1 SDR family oxidoreductase [Polycladospora coralii]
MYQTALITGASSGIGEAFARELAKQKYHLVLVARNTEKLNQIASELAKQYDISVHVITADLSQPHTASSIYQQTEERGIQVDFLINNAGFGTFGPFHTIDPKSDHDQVMVNVATLVDLVHLYLPAMVSRKQGQIINVASMAGFIPLPYMAVYGATKAFVISFSEALWSEYREYGIHILALCPGYTKTNFFQTANVDASVPKKGLRTPEQVVQSALTALKKGKDVVVDGKVNRSLWSLIKITPRKQITSLVKKTLAKEFK